MPEDTSRRIVIVTDGNENVGQARKLAARVAASGIGFDVVPVMLDCQERSAGRERSTCRPTFAKASLSRRVSSSTIIVDGDEHKSGRRQVARQAENGRRRNIVVGRARHVGCRQECLFRYVIRLNNRLPTFTKLSSCPDTHEDDGLSQNNTATAYTHVRGKGRVLMIEDRAREGDFDLMIDALRDANIEIVSTTTTSSSVRSRSYKLTMPSSWPVFPRVSGESTDADHVVHGRTD